MCYVLLEFDSSVQNPGYLYVTNANTIEKVYTNFTKRLFCRSYLPKSEFSFLNTNSISFRRSVGDILHAIILGNMDAKIIYLVAISSHTIKMKHSKCNTNSNFYSFNNRIVLQRNCLPVPLAIYHISSHLYLFKRI